MPIIVSKSHFSYLFYYCVINPETCAYSVLIIKEHLYTDVITTQVDTLILGEIHYQEIFNRITKKIPNVFL